MKPLLKNISGLKYSFLILAVSLFSLSFVFNKLYSDRSAVLREARLAGQYLEDQQNDFNNFLKDTALINKLVSNTETLDQFFRLASKRYSIFLYTADTFGATDMKFWSEQLITPSPELLQAEDGEYFSKLSNGWYYTIKKTLGTAYIPGGVVSYAMIPVQSEFFITTDYLPEKFAYSKTAEKRVLIAKTETEFPVKNASGKTVFYLDKKIPVLCLIIAS